MSSAVKNSREGLTAASRGFAYRRPLGAAAVLGVMQAYIAREPCFGVVMSRYGIFRMGTYAVEAANQNIFPPLSIS